LTALHFDSASDALEFELPAALEAHEPPEARGLARDEVRLLVAERGSGRLSHARFRDLPQFLAPGDVVVVNTSATLPSALPAWRADGTELELRLSTPAPELAGRDWWIVEGRTADGTSSYRGLGAGESIALPGDGRAELAAPFASGTRLWLARLVLGEALETYLARYGRPIRYGYVPREWPLRAYQTVYASEPGSAEMPSAGRPFSTRLIAALAARGVHFAPLTLHTGVSSPEADEPPYPERYRVLPETAAIVNAARAWGGRVIAVGTTVVRALETVADDDGRVRPGSGWTEVVVTPERGLRAVDGLVTGWHEPRASHLRLLEAVAGRELLEHSYRAALRCGYRWHEFGDIHLILPPRSSAA
jgi:S-adenosylmethionine:tRNA ribosyltransferase-isomerase